MWQQLKLGSQQEGRSMDVSEIHSQAMQMLTLPYYEIFYGEDAGTAANMTSIPWWQESLPQR